MAAAFVLAISGVSAWAQAKPVVAVLSTDSTLYASAAINDSKPAPRLSEGEPLLVLGAQDKKLTLDGVPTLWYQVKTSEAATGWIPGSRMAFTSTSFKRPAFRTQDQYAAYVIMAARPGEKVVAARSYEKVAKGDIGWYVTYHDGELPAAIVWERNLEATPADEYLPTGFPAALKPFVYFVDFTVFELAGDQATGSFTTLAQTLPGKYPEPDGYYAGTPDDDFPWYTPPEASYVGYGDRGDYSGDYEDGSEDGSSIDEAFTEGIESYGFIKEGSTVILGRHEELNGGSNWADEMDSFVGKEAVVTSLPGADSQGFLVVRVKGNDFVWRVRNLALKGRGEPGSYGYQTGDSVVIGAHRYIAGDNNWADEMLEYVGQVATITSMEGTDGTGSSIVHVDIDDGDWYWRVETLSPAN
jgi:hypothetical protein